MRDPDIPPAASEKTGQDTMFPAQRTLPRKKSRRAAAPALSEVLSRNVCPLCGPELQPDQLVFPVAEPNGFGMRNLAAPVGNGVNAGKVIMPGVIALAQHA